MNIYMDYPKSFTEEQKKLFDKIRELVKKIPNYICLIYDGTTNILIETTNNHLTEEMVELLDKINQNENLLSIVFVPASLEIPGERYV